MSTQIQRRRGTTAEHSTFTGVEGELTVDTTKDTVVVHDGATVGGHPLQKQYPALGSASAPTYTFTGDTNTGIYSPGADQLALSTNGTGRLFVRSNGSVELNGPARSQLQLGVGDNVLYSIGRDNGDGYLYFNGNQSGVTGYIFSSPNGERLRITPAGLVGIGSSSPQATLHLRNNSGQILEATSATTALPITFRASYGEDAAQITGGDYSNDFKGYLTFKTRVQYGALQDRMTIDSSGRVGIGTTSPDVDLAIQSSSTNSIVKLKGTSSTNGGQLQVNATNFILRNRDNGSLQFWTNDSEKAQIDSSGRLLVGTSTARSNIQFGGTAPAAPPLQIETAVGSRATGLSVINNSSGGFGGLIRVGSSAGSTVGSNNLVGSGVYYGMLSFVANDGTNFVEGARISAVVDGTSGTGDLPTRLEFSTTADGASSPTEHLRINSNGSFHFSTNGSYTSAGGTYNEIYNSNNNVVALYVRHTNTDPYGLQIYYDQAKNNTGNEFLYCSDASAQRATIRSNGGIANYQANNVNLSDINTKKDIAPAAGTWDCIKEWEIVNYRYKDQPDDADLNLGVIAQQVAESCPEVVTVFEEAKDDQPEKLGVKEQQMYWMTIKALQEAQVRIEALEAEVAALKAQ